MPDGFGVRHTRAQVSTVIISPTCGAIGNEFVALRQLLGAADFIRIRMLLTRHPRLLQATLSSHIIVESRLAGYCRILARLACEIHIAMQRIPRLRAHRHHLAKLEGDIARYVLGIGAHLGRLIEPHAIVTDTLANLLRLLAVIPIRTVEVVAHIARGLGRARRFAIRVRGLWRLLARALGQTEKGLVACACFTWCTNGILADDCTITVARLAQFGAIREKATNVLAIVQVFRLPAEPGQCQQQQQRQQRYQQPIYNELREFILI